MAYWSDGVMMVFLLLAALLAVGHVLHKTVPLVPASILAGLVGLALGPSVFGLLPLHGDVLESVVYHGLAVVFIAGGLQSGGGTGGGGARAFMLGIPTMVVLQSLVGLGAILVLGLATGTAMHPGYGLILPMGFEQGPGQALSLGAAWEESGMADGAQVGLIVAALGFGWAIGGVVLVAWGRARGLVSAPQGPAEPEVVVGSQSGGGSLERLTMQLALICGCYLITWAIVAVAARLLALTGDDSLVAMAWGFHFIIGALVALGARRVVAPLTDDALLGQVGGATVEVITAGAIAAIQVAVLTSHLLPIALVTTLGGVTTAFVCLWLARRAFDEAPFEHALLWYGMSTGTLPLGLALLRMVDPHLRTPVKMNAVVGSALSVPWTAVPVLVLMPMAVSGSAWMAMGLYVLYLAGLLGVWALGFTGAKLKWVRPLAVWP